MTTLWQVHSSGGMANFSTLTFDFSIDKQNWYGGGSRGTPGEDPNYQRWNNSSLECTNYTGGYGYWGPYWYAPHAAFAYYKITPFTKFTYKAYNYSCISTMNAYYGSDNPADDYMPMGPWLFDNGEFTMSTWMAPDPTVPITYSRVGYRIWGLQWSSLGSLGVWAPGMAYSNLYWIKIEGLEYAP